MTKFIDFNEAIINLNSVEFFTTTKPEQIEKEKKYKDDYGVFCIFKKKRGFTGKMFYKEKDRDEFWNELKKLLCEAEK